MTDLHRGDVVLVSFPFVAGGEFERKRRPALIVQSDRYNRRRAAVILVAITSSRMHHELPSQVAVSKDTPEGRQAGLRLDSVVDCQTLVTVPREEIRARLGRFPLETMGRVDRALEDALGLAATSSSGGESRRPGR
jgi:mRNA-degrading endonuclease toxin of MazEF toxin-antitoxin module